MTRNWPENRTEQNDAEQQQQQGISDSLNNQETKDKFKEELARKEVADKATLLKLWNEFSAMKFDLWSTMPSKDKVSDNFDKMVDLVNQLKTINNKNWAEFQKTLNMALTVVSNMMNTDPGKVGSIYTELDNLSKREAPVASTRNAVSSSISTTQISGEQTLATGWWQSRDKMPIWGFDKNWNGSFNWMKNWVRVTASWSGNTASWSGASNQAGVIWWA